jgi:hypothetical protein
MADWLLKQTGSVLGFLGNISANSEQTFDQRLIDDSLLKWAGSYIQAGKFTHKVALNSGTRPSFKMFIQVSFGQGKTCVDRRLIEPSRRVGAYR